MVALFILPSVLADDGTDPFEVIVDERVQDLLRENILAGDPMDPHDVIIRFSSRVNDEDRRLLGSLGLTIMSQGHVVPTVQAIGPAEGIARLSTYDHVEYIENNSKLVFFNEVSTEAMKSSWAWDRIIGGEATIRGDGIDGTGVSVVVIDTGVDAGHPDLDYLEKTVVNLKSDNPDGPWIEMENSDTTGGHGTHVAGTVASNGDVSAGSRAGSAPGANLIGLSVGEGGSIMNGVGAFEWTYDNSRPGNNPHNIRVCTNSWGGSGNEFDPKSILTILSNKLTYENNVVVLFAAGNSGYDDHDGHKITTNPPANNPPVINVAATYRDHEYMAWFSSRGQWNKTQTYPDVATPGFFIMSTKARTPQSINGIIESGRADFYAQQMSGTSMATPHCAGVVALLWQAAPSMRTSDVHQDFLYPDDNDEERQARWYEDPLTRIHEAELILKLSADYVEWAPRPQDKWGYNDTGVAKNQTRVPIGLDGRRVDWAQGYGFANVDAAVSLALTLERLRGMDPEATVFDALEQYNATRKEGMVMSATNSMQTGWHAEYTTLSDKGLNLIPEDDNELANQTKLVWIPKGADRVEVSIDYDIYIPDKFLTANLDLAVDIDGAFSDQDFEYSPRTLPNARGHKTYTLMMNEAPFQGHDDHLWGFNALGQVVGTPDMDGYWDIRIEYDVQVRVVFENLDDTVEVAHKDTHSFIAQWRHSEPTPSYNGGELGLVLRHYDLADVRPLSGEYSIPERGEVHPLFITLMAFLIIGLVSLVSYIRGLCNGGITDGEDSLGGIRAGIGRLKPW